MPMLLDLYANYNFVTNKVVTLVDMVYSDVIHYR
jgi:hypothetical protein